MGWFGRSDDDYQEEIREHVELETQANIDRGMSADDARRAARVSFGSVAAVRQRLYEGRSTSWLSTSARDARYGARMIQRNPLLSCIVVLTLSVGIGLTGAVFSLVRLYAFSPPVSHDPDSYVTFVSDDEYGNQVATVPRYEALREQTRSIRELAAWSAVTSHGPLGPTTAAGVGSMFVSCNFFSVFTGETPIVGRYLQAADCAGAQPVMVISERLWRDRFANDPAIVGTSTAYGGQPLTIVGVAAPPAMGEGFVPDVWLPYTIQPSLKELAPSHFSKQDLVTSRDFYWLGMAGRLQRGYSREEAAAEFLVLTSREPRDPQFDSGLNRLRLIDGSMWSTAPLMMLEMFAYALALPTLVMLIVCATVATLLLSRAVGRQREMAVRLALGATRFRLVRMLLAETLLLSGLAAAVSLGFVYSIPPLLVRFLFQADSSPAAPAGIAPDWWVFVYMGVVAILAAVLSGLTPALESLNPQLGESLKGRRVFGKYRGASRMRGVLVGVEVALCLVPLVGAAMLLRAQHRLAHPGFETRQVVYAEMPRTQRTAETQSSVADSILTISSTTSVAHAESLPLVFEDAMFAELPGQPRQPLLTALVSPTYFRTLGIPIVSGRSFENADLSRKAGVKPGVVSRQFARRFFPGQNALGKTFQAANPDGTSATSLEIIGIAEDRATGFGPFRVPNDGSFVYQLMEPSLKGYVMVRFDGDARGFVPALQSVLENTTGMVVTVSTIQSVVDARTVGISRVRTLLSILGAISLALALIGVFGVFSFALTQRRKDLAIRLALGARRAEIFQTVIVSGLRPIPIGLLAGLTLSFGAVKVAESQRFAPLGPASQDPIPYIAAGIILLLAVFAAMVSPAYRAVSSDPLPALREE